MKDTEIVRHLAQSISATKASLNAVEKWAKLLQEDGEDKKVESLSEEVIETSLYRQNEEDERVLEGYFDGYKMVADQGSEFAVPANYASKSKLVEGDRLKLVIKPNGAFVFKQIQLIPRKTVVGKLILEGNQYKVLTAEREYNILYASVTFYKGKIGDKVTILIPENQEVSWGAVENIIPAEIE